MLFPEADGSTAPAPPRRAAILVGSSGRSAAGGAGVSALPCPAQSGPLSVLGASPLSASFAWPLAAGRWSDPAVEGLALAGRGEWGLQGELGERGLPILRLEEPGAGLRAGLCVAVCLLVRSPGSCRAVLGLLGSKGLGLVPRPPCLCCIDGEIDVLW